jgi:hypothetical protein
MTDLRIELPNRVHVLSKAGRVYMLDHERAPNILHQGQYLVTDDAEGIGRRASDAGLAVDRSPVQD